MTERGEQSTPGMDAWTEEFLLAYRAHRVDDQMAYYARRAEENERARRQALWVSALCLVLAALFGALATADEERRQLWAVLAASFGALATAVGAYEAAFGFERLSRQSEDTRGALHIADLRGPQGDQAVQPAERGEVLEYVEEIEAILRSEVETWSQFTAHQARESADSLDELPGLPPSRRKSDS